MNESKFNSYFLFLLVIIILSFSAKIRAEDTINVIPEEDLVLLEDSILQQEQYLQDNLNTIEDPDILAGTGLPEEIPTPGIIEGLGTGFEVNDSEYLNITLVSTEPIQLTLESIPNMVTIYVEAAEEVTSSHITLGGLEPLTKYYKYEDNYHNLEELTTDENGSVSYTQDLTKSHIIFIQPIRSTIYLSNIGWSKPEIGTWDPLTLTGTLTTDVFETIQIDNDGITLDGNGHTVSGSGSGQGVFLSYKTAVTIKNITIQNFYTGIYPYRSNNINIIRNTTLNNNNHGISLVYTNNSTIMSNIVSNSKNSGIFIRDSRYNNITDNVVEYNDYGIFLYPSSWSIENTITNNMFSFNTRGIMIYPTCDNIILNDNTISDNIVGMIITSNNNTINNNTIKDNTGTGVVIQNSQNHTFTYNTVITNGDDGINTDNIANINFNNNIISYNGKSGVLISADNINFSDNVVRENNNDGIVIVGYNNFIADNFSILNGNYGIYIRGSDNFIINNVSTANSDGFLIYPKNSLTGNDAISNNVSGFHTFGECILTGNFAYNNQYGFYISNNSSTLSGNIATNNDYGMLLYYHTADNNELSNNTVSDNYYGIYLFYDANSNLIFINNISDNVYGIFLNASSGNLIYNNDFINNSYLQAYSHNSSNTFNQPAPVGGNYWNDFTEPDANNDGFVDYSYVIKTNNPSYPARDYLPLASPFGGGADNEAPTILNITVEPALATVGSEVTLSAILDDTGSGGSDINYAECGYDGEEWITMDPEDGSWDSPTESAFCNLSAPESAGVYNLCVRASDSFDNMSDSECTLLVVYDPDGGFVTGGGWIYSPEGAYTADPALIGKANFGFVSKYKKGTTIPTGQTEFQFKVADLNFHSDFYEWLVVAGPQAKFKGGGTINDTGNYGFMLSAVDSAINGGGDSDKFRIKIWDKDNNDITIYDNLLDAPDDAEPTTVLGGGSIVIHKD